MYWTLELASKFEDAPWPATKEGLIDDAVHSGAPLEVLENLQEIEDEGEIYKSIKDIYEGENETYIEASVENSSSILYDKEIRNKPRTRRTKRNV